MSSRSPAATPVRPWEQKRRGLLESAILMSAEELKSNNPLVLSTSFIRLKKKNYNEN